MRQKRLNYEGSVVVVFWGSFLGQIIVSKSPLVDDETRRAKLRDLLREYSKRTSSHQLLCIMREETKANE